MAESTACNLNESRGLYHFPKNVVHALELRVKHVSLVLRCMFQSRHVEATYMSMRLQLSFTIMARDIARTRSEKPQNTDFSWHVPGVTLTSIGIVHELEIPCALVASPVCPGTHSVKGRTPSSLPARPVGMLASVGIV